jgi:hypothetical protein
MWAVGLQEDKLRKLGDVVCKGEPVEAQVSGPKKTSATAAAQTGDPNERCGDECVQCLKVRQQGNPAWDDSGKPIHRELAASHGSLRMRTTTGEARAHGTTMSVHALML